MTEYNINIDTVSNKIIITRDGVANEGTLENFNLEAELEEIPAVDGFRQHQATGRKTLTITYLEEGKEKI